MRRFGAFSSLTHFVLASTFTLFSLSAVRADEIKESNYQHIMREDAVVIDGFYTAEALAVQPRRWEQAQLGAGVLRPPQGANKAFQLSSITTPEFAHIAILFKEDMCVLGFKHRFKGETNKQKVTFTFISRDGETINTQTRWPAGGTTRQAYSATSFAHRFQAVEIKALAGISLSIGDIKAMPCVLALS